MDLAFFLLLLLPLLFLLNHSKPQRGRAPPLPGSRGWPVLGNLLQLGAMPHRTLDALSKKFGPLFRLRLGSVEVVVAASAEVASEFLRTHDAIFSDRPPNSGAEHVAYNYQDLVFAPYGPRWRALRKLCSLHLFSSKALDDLRGVREGKVGLLVRDLAGARPSGGAERREGGRRGAGRERMRGQRDGAGLGGAAGVRGGGRRCGGVQGDGDRADEAGGSVQRRGLRAVAAGPRSAGCRRKDEAAAPEVRRDHRGAPPGVGSGERRRGEGSVERDSRAEGQKGRGRGCR